MSTQDGIQLAGTPRQAASSEYNKHTRYGTLLSKMQWGAFLERSMFSFPRPRKQRTEVNIYGTLREHQELCYSAFLLHGEEGEAIGLNPELILHLAIRYEVTSREGN